MSGWVSERVREGARDLRRSAVKREKSSAYSPPIQRLPADYRPKPERGGAEELLSDMRARAYERASMQGRDRANEVTD